MLLKAIQICQILSRNEIVYLETIKIAYNFNKLDKINNESMKLLQIV